MSNPRLRVYQLASCVALPRRERHLVVDPDDAEHPYTVTQHFAPGDIDLAQLIASGTVHLLLGSPVRLMR